MATLKSTASFTLQDRIFRLVTLMFAALVFVMLAGIIVGLVIQAAPTFKTFGLPFIWTEEWNINEDLYGALDSIYGTVVTTLIAMLIAVPISFGLAVFLVEMCPEWLKRPLSIALELLAGIPSIIYGIWGLTIFAPFFRDHVQPILQNTLGRLPVIGELFSGPMIGVGVLTAGVILSVMVLPFIASVIRDVFETVPPMLKESAYGIGCTRWEVVRRIMLPYSFTGVVGAVMLGFGRAMGETMAVTFVIGNSHRIMGSLFAPGTSIAATLANEFGEADPGLHTSSLFALGLILFVITFVVLALAKVMINRNTAAKGR